MINAVEPWMSAEDIETGARWSNEIALRLNDTQFGIICLTPENLFAPWILFESGALSKTIENARVCPYLFGLRATDVNGPLVQFQSTLTDKRGTFKLVQTLNRSLGQTGLPAVHLEEAFEVWWPKLEQKLTAIPSLGMDVSPKRSEREILEELLDLTRQGVRNTSTQTLIGEARISQTGAIPFHNPTAAPDAVVRTEFANIDLLLLCLLKSGVPATSWVLARKT